MKERPPRYASPLGMAPASASARVSRREWRLLRASGPSLPSFPRPVIDLWFDHAAGQGWPPPLDHNGVPTGHWRNVLGDRPLAFWRTVSWTHERVPITLGLLEPKSAHVVGGIMAAFNLGLPGGIPGMTTVDYRRRIEAFRAILLRTQQQAELYRPRALPQWW